MEENIRKKYDRAAKIIGIIIGILFVLGISYAVFRTVTKGEQDSVISAGKLDVRIENEQDEITLENAFPITEEEGKSQTPYTFDVVNKGTINAEYDLYIEIDESVSTLPTDVVRYYLTVEEDGIEKIVTSSARTISQEEVIEKEGKKLYKIDNKYLDTSKSNHYKLYLWIDEETTAEQAINKTFEAKVSIEAVQIYDENRLVQQIDVSANGDGSVTAYMYANGNIVIKGQGQIKNHLSDTLIYISEETLNIYKKVYIAAGCPAEDINSFTSSQEFENYLMNLQEEDPELFQSIMSQDMNTLLQLVVMKDVLEDLGYDTNGIELTTDAYMAYLIEQGLMDEEGQFTEEGQEFYTKVEEKANSLNSSTIPIKSIVLEDGITNIPNGLFTGNEDITEVRIPASVTTIESSAFSGCTGLTEIVLPNNIISIGSNAFYNCQNLKSITIPDDVTKIQNSTFYNCSSLVSIKIPNSVTTIGNDAFCNCANLTEVILSPSITEIGWRAFENCSKIKKLTIGVNSTTQGEYNEIWGGVSNIEELIIVGNGQIRDRSSTGPHAAWEESVGSIKKIVIEEGVTSIGRNVFKDCINLTTVSMGDSILSIGSSAFNGCSKLTSIELSKNLTSIGGYAFQYCTNLKSIEIPSSVTDIGSFAFSGCRGLTSIIIPKQVKSISSNLFENCTNLLSVEIANGVETIEGSAFENCKNLIEINIPSSVINIEEASYAMENITAFSDCESLISINVDKNNSNYSSIDGVLYNKDITTLLKCPPGKEIVNIPNDVNKIENGAFYWCRKLNQISISDSVKTIGSYAFFGCVLPEIMLPASVSSMGANVFSRWDSSQIINIDNTEAYVDRIWKSNWKSGCSATINYLRS